VHAFTERGFSSLVDVAADGRYTFSGLPAARLVRVVWIPTIDVNGYLQLQPANVMTGATIAAQRDIAIVRRNARDFVCASPALSGLVYDTKTAGPRPLPRTRVIYTVNDYPGFDAYTETDADGRFRFCGLPAGVGRLGVGDCNDAVLPQSVQVNGDTIVDVDLTAFNASCP